ncbi:MAG TPA: Gfo/Idh/MocA family oxidoreductase [Chryseolinea sp.]|jgi:predicted homoserine dehydrogenase-like protein|nr:Gfo/Idh/MocA family oxidoreductase [Chryseolinea sp.]
MVIVDTALAKRQEENNPVRVGLVGAGFMGRGIVLQIANSVPGMELVAIYNRSVEGAKRAYREAGIEDFEVVNTQAALEDRIAKGKYTITEDPFLLCKAENIDVLVEVTGAVEFSSRVAFEAIKNKKHVVIMDAELDGTVGAILKVHADKAGVVITNADGDQPGVEMNLFRFVKSIGVKPVLCGNIKGLQDPYRNPTTQEGFAKKWGQNPAMVTSFADGTKISFEQAIVANATGMTIGRRGMYGPTVPSGTPLKEIMSKYPLDVLTSGPGIVDYCVGAEPGPGVFVLGTHDHPKQKHYLNLYKLGEGPLYLFYTPYHLCHFEVPLTCARAVLFNDAAITPLGAPLVEVVTTAKIDLKAGQSLDGIGCYMTYGQCETAEITGEQQLLPMGLAEGCVLTRDIPKDQVITYADVILPKGRFCDKLRQEQNEYFKVTV